MAIIHLVGVRDDGAPGFPSNYELEQTFTTPAFNQEFGGDWTTQRKALYRKYCGEPIYIENVSKEWDMVGGSHGATVLKIVCKI
ncbi:hypothetical protein GR211_33255 [Rhizobium leguminosarum]|nr:hypothetical protein [Rhizobium ruizarguesonis]NEJ17717.1 hypothetical protein [Rhizobium ruizarguesonis]NEK31695.1 hypothetical protein [Rhizobium ruizarguesonis]